MEQEGPAASCFSDRLGRIGGLCLIGRNVSHLGGRGSQRGSTWSVFVPFPYVVFSGQLCTACSRC